MELPFVRSVNVTDKNKEGILEEKIIIIFIYLPMVPTL